MQTADLNRWPVPGGFLERLGGPPEEIEARSRALARAAVGDRWQGLDAGLAASVVYASGDPELAGLIQISGDPAVRAQAALRAEAPILVDVAMVAAGVGQGKGHRLSVAIEMRGARRMAHDIGITRAAAGMRLAWGEAGARPVVAIGNAPTALLAVLDLATAGSPPTCVIATCPGFNIAAEAKAALAGSGIPHLLVSGTRGGSGLAAAAVNFLLEQAGYGR